MPPTNMGKNHTARVISKHTIQSLVLTWQVTLAIQLTTNKIYKYAMYVSNNLIMYILIYASHYDLSLIDKSDFYFAAIIFIFGPIYAVLFVMVNKNVLMEVIQETVEEKE